MVFDRRGKPVAGKEEQRPYEQTTTADGGVEADGEMLLARTVACLERFRDDRSIAAVGISCFWHSLVGVGGGGGAVTPVYSWADARSAKHAARLSHQYDEAAYHARTGCVFHPSYWPAKLLWLAEEQPELFGRAALWMSFGEYLLLRLFGSSPCSLSMASGAGLFDPNRGDWDPQALAMVPIDAEHLSRLAGRGEAVSGAKNGFAEALGVLGDIPWYPAIGDGACSNVGSGAASGERIAINVGTSGAMRVAVKAPSVKVVDGLFCYRIDAERFLLGGAVSCAGNIHAWEQETLKLDGSPAAARKLASMRPDSHGLTILPFWAGERSPGWHSGARGTITGMNLHTTPLDIARASHEAVAYTFADILDRLRGPFPGEIEIVASGGAVRRNPGWVQIMADVFGSVVRISEVSEASSRGAALLALASAGVIDGAGDAPAYLGRAFTPDAENHAVYLKARQRYAALYDLILDRFDRQQERK